MSRRLLVASLCVAAACVLPLARAADVLSIINANPQFSLYASLLQSTALDKGLTGNGPYSLFVPTNAAFARLAPAVVPYYNATANLDILVSLLAYHIVTQTISVPNLIPNQEFLTAEGDPIFVEYIHGTTNLGLQSSTCQKSVNFVGTQSVGSNGNVQAIDTVMFPQDLACPNKLFWAESTGSQRIGNLGYDCRSTGFTVYANTSTPVAVKNPLGLALDDDPTNVQVQFLFWGDSVSQSATANSFLSSVYFTSSQLQPILTGVIDPRGMDTWSTNNVTALMFASHSGHAVYTCVYDGAYYGPFWNFTSNEYPVDVAVDVNVWLLFVAVQVGPSLSSGYLMTVSLYQQNATTVLDNIPGLVALCLDRASRHAYIATSSGSILCYAYGKTPCVRATIITGLPSPNFCAVDYMYVPYGGSAKIAISSTSTNSIFTVDSVSGGLVAIATDMGGPAGIKFGCMPRQSVLEPVWKIAAVTFGDAMLAASTSIIDVIFPGSTFRAYPAVTTQEEPETICPAMLADFVSYTVAQGKTWNNAVKAVTAGAIASGPAGIYPGITTAAASFRAAADILRTSNHSISAGAGVGFAVSVQCNFDYLNTTVLFSYGVALGGGMGPSGLGFQGGAAGISINSDYVSGGGRCVCTDVSCSNCIGGATAGSVGTVGSLSAAIQSAASQCPPGNLLVCASGTGSGGWTNDWCEYGAGFGVSFETQLITPADDKLGGTPGPALCAIDPQALAINTAVATCSAECYGDADYYACYCPCYILELTSNGVLWAADLTC